MTGDELLDVVETYEAFGDHRAGSEAEQATANWMADQLATRGLSTSLIPIPFDRYLTKSSLTADGQPIDHLPAYYEWTGTIDTTDVHIAAVDVRPGGHIGALDAATAAARQTGRAGSVLATEHDNGSLIAVNRQVRPHGGHPTVLIAGRDLSTVSAAGEVRLQLSATLGPGTAYTVEARNRPAENPLILTTPLTGWFGCAGERGTGIAVLLELVERFASEPLLVLATGAHELDYFGVRRWVAETEVTPKAIVHVGASPGVDQIGVDGQRQLIRSRVAITDQTGTIAEQITTALEPAAFMVHTGTDRWMGESEVFCTLGRPMLSFTGNGIDFHTPEDRSPEVTSAHSLAIVAESVANAVDALIST
jgi:hypothetical protein